MLMTSFNQKTKLDGIINESYGVWKNMITTNLSLKSNPLHNPILIFRWVEYFLSQNH